MSVKLRSFIGLFVLAILSLWNGLDYVFPRPHEHVENPLMWQLAGLGLLIMFGFVFKHLMKQKYPY